MKPGNIDLQEYVLVHHTHDEDIETAHQKRILAQQEERRKRLLSESIEDSYGNSIQSKSTEHAQQQNPTSPAINCQGKSDTNQANDNSDNLDDDDDNNDMDDGITLAVPEVARNLYMHMLIKSNNKTVLLKREIDGPLAPTLARIAKKFKLKPAQVQVDATGAPASGEVEDVHGNPINVNAEDSSTLSNYWAFRAGSFLELGDVRVPVFHHAPVVVSLFVRGFPMVGCSLHPIVTLHNCNTNTCRWEWYRTNRYAEHKIIEDVNAFGQHANISVDLESDVLVASSRTYTPTKDDTGFRLLCVCTPMNELCAGIPAVVLVGARDDTRINRMDFFGFETESNSISNGAIASLQPSNNIAKNAHASDSCKSSFVQPANPKMATASCQTLSRSVTSEAMHPVVLARKAFASSRELSPGMLRVVSYNILHDMFCDSAWALKNLYPYLDPRCAKTNFRHRRIAEEIAAYLPDVVCLQEVGHAEFHEVLEPRLSTAGR